MRTLESMDPLLLIFFLVGSNWLACGPAKAFQYDKPQQQLLTKFFAVFLLLITSVVRLVNTVNDTTQIIHPDQPAPVSPLAQQTLRIILNTGALLTVLYFETYVSLQISNSMVQRQQTDNKGLDASMRANILVLSFYISLMFLTQAILQLFRLLNITAFAPFYGFSWAICLRRIIQFKEDLNGKRKATQHNSLSHLSRAKSAPGITNSNNALATN